MDNSPNNSTVDSTYSNGAIDDLALVCLSGDEGGIVRLLEEHGHELINKKDVNGNAPIHVACQAGVPAAVRLLVKHGADRTIKNGCGASPMEIAIFGDHSPIVQILSESDPNTESSSSALDFEQSQLQYAAIFGRTSILKWTLENGADANARGTGGKTAAHHVCALPEGHCGSVDCLNTLIEHGADLKIQDDEGRMPIHRVRSGAVMEALVKTWGMDPNIPDANGWTPLLHATSTPTAGCAEVCSILLQNGANTHAVTDDGDTPLHLALRHGAETATILLEHETVDIAAKDGRGRTALHLILALHRREDYILRFLKTHYLPSGCDIDESTDTGW